MRCEQCQYCKREEKDVSGSGYTRTYINVYKCSASKSGKRKLGEIYNGLVSYNHKVIYQPKWCPLLVNKGE